MNKFPIKAENSNEDLNVESFKKRLRTINREKLTFFLISGTVTTLGVIYSLIAKPIYKGSFDIVVDIGSKGQREIDLSLSSILDNSLIKGLNSTINKLDTQEYILKSPSVLMPIFEEVKKSKIKEDIKYQELDYSDWKKKYLKVNFTDSTNILSISYKDNNKNDIIQVLNKISNKYKEYSLRDRQRDLDRSLNYLKAQQKIYQKKSENSIQAFNLFSIKNGLGNIDGFVGLDANNNMSYSTNSANGTSIQTDGNPDFNNLKLLGGINPTNKIRLNTNNSSAGQRFNSQFQLLEQYEAQFTNLSLRLNPNSKTLRDLKIKIDKIRSSLKRPNKILIEYQNLKKAAQRDEALLVNIENQLNIVNLEKARQELPWEIISKPTIEKYRVFPKRKQIVGISFFISILIGALITYLKEKRQAFIFELEELKEMINTDPMDILSFGNPSLNFKIFKYLLNDYKKNCSIGIITKSSNKEILNQIMNLKDFKFIEISLVEDYNIEKCDYFLYLVESGKYKAEDLELLKRYITFSKNKFIGWFFIT